jgi:hypothetical protein
VLIVSTASYNAFMSLWIGLNPRLREKAGKSIRHTLKAEILSKSTADDATPAVEPTPTLELDPELLEAFLAEPEPEEINLGTLVPPHRSDGHRIGVESGIENESASGRIGALGENNGDGGITEDSQDVTAGDDDEDIIEDDDYGLVEDLDRENTELSEVDDEV